MYYHSSLNTGFLGEGEDYFLHDDTLSVYDLEMNGYDLYANTTPEWEYAGQYSTEVFSQKAIDLIRTHDKTQVGLTEPFGRYIIWFLADY